MSLHTLALAGCGGGDDGDGGGGSCDMIANPDGPAYFKVVNNLSSGLAWSFQDSYAFGADMKPGECTNMGVVVRQYTVRFQQCNIGDGACTSDIGSPRDVVFSVAQGETHTETVDSNFFN